MTTGPRLWCPTELAEGHTAQGSAGQAHHLRSVLRRGPGDPVLLFNARDGEFAGQIDTLRRDAISFRVMQRRR
jgi:16S rRNA (uracil1498-N3)-methyltransferase